jgi:signal transduction histidine kinase
LLLLVLVLGGAGSVLLHRLGGSIGAILRENYASVIYMERLNEALERIDSSFQFALAGRELDARQQYVEHWKQFYENLEKEGENITLPGEGDLVEELTALGEDYHRRGDTFFERPLAAERNEIYFQKPGGLLDLFQRIKVVSGRILRINQENMEQASQAAREAARFSLLGFAVGCALAVTLAAFLAWHTVHRIVQPIRAVTESALAISAGNLDQVVPVVSNDELGQVAEAFNLMAHRLRDYRQSQSAQLLRVQRTTQATIDSFPDPVLVIDPDGHVELANPAARRLLGVVPSQPGQPAAAIWHSPEPLRQALAEALRGQRDYLPEGFDRAIMLGSSGRERVVLPRILTIRDPYGVVLGAAVLLQDVTRLRLLDQVKGNLVATASHELKTPLTSIRLAVHLLLEEAAGPLTPKQTELLVDARENCERLLVMVNSLLDLARLEQGWRQLDVRPEAPGSLLQAAAEAIRPRAQDKGVEIVLDVPPDLPRVSVDGARIGTALRNLLDNALMYTDPGGRITLAAAANGDAVTCTVTDTGVGIPNEYIPHLFEKFFRIPGQSRESGTGLGLAIVHEIVVAHGGTITCDSQPGVGTTFRLTLPVATAGDISETVFGHAGGDGEAKR